MGRENQIPPGVILRQGIGPQIMPVEYAYGGPAGGNGWESNSPPGASSGPRNRRVGRCPTHERNFCRYSNGGAVEACWHSPRRIASVKSPQSPCSSFLL